MFASRPFRRAFAWAAVVLAAQAQNVIIDALSFGHKGAISPPDQHGIPGWQVTGQDYTPDVLSDRVMLTPPYPGNRRGALWAAAPLEHPEWSAELEFRASGPERGSGNLQLWYTKGSLKDAGAPSVYTTAPFDGLVLVVNQHGGRGGTIRAFLSDATVSFKDHHDVDQLSFGQCDYPYRNLGRFSVLRVKQTGSYFEVSIDGNPCFSTDKVKLPPGYFFGLSASSAENPDSFEIHKFVTASINSNQRHQPPAQQPPPPQQQQQQQQQQQHQQQADADGRANSQQLSDVVASLAQTREQVTDLNNRIQGINQQAGQIHALLEQLSQRSDERFGRAVQAYDRTNALANTVEKLERMLGSVQHDLAGKDYKETLNRLHSAVQESHNSLTQGLPEAMNQIVHTAKPKLTTFLLIVVAAQVVILGGYLFYKRRRQNAPKKYL